MPMCNKTKAWSVADIPPQTGKIALVTGPTIGGLGFQTALALASAGAQVILAGRNEEKGKEAAEKILATVPEAKIDFVKVDLSSLASVEECANNVLKKYEKLDILINNAALMAPPKREVTKDGYEVQFGTNYLSHFALTARLLPLLRKSPNPRIVQVSSIASNDGKINFEDLQSEKCSYDFDVYAQSKLASLMFAFELQRRSDKGGWGIHSVAAHPGIAKTELVANGMGDNTLKGFVLKGAVRLFGGDPKDGALPSLFAATSPEAEKGGYYGPGGFREMKGHVGPATIAEQAKDEAVASKLWDVSTELTGVNWP
jgi:NAD(P)-dependent dehydrogenase (short-subunit alcohol dehydrogenase family)